MEHTQFVGLDFNDPEVDVLKIAGRLGAHTAEITNSDMIVEALNKAFDYSGPSFIIIRRES